MVRNIQFTPDDDIKSKLFMYKVNENAEMKPGGGTFFGIFDIIVSINNLFQRQHFNVRHKNTICKFCL